MIRFLTYVAFFILLGVGTYNLSFQLDEIRRVEEAMGFTLGTVCLTGCAFLALKLFRREQ